MKLTVVGQGIRAFEQITLEGLRALQSAKKVLYLSVNDSKEVKSFLLGSGVHYSENIKTLYEDAALDQENYQRLLNKILEESKEHLDVALLLPGHPRVGVTLVKWLENEKKILLSIYVFFLVFLVLIR